MKHRICSVFSATLAFIIVLAMFSCSATNEKEEPSTDSGTAEHVSPAPYADADISYTLTVSDGKYSVTLKVTRNGGISEAEITSPSGLAGVHIVSDSEGLRITPPNGELLVPTDEVGAGLQIFFDVMAQIPSDGERTADGLYSFCRSGFDVTLLLSEDGLPRLITVQKDGVTRHGEIAFTENPS